MSIVYQCIEPIDRYRRLSELSTQATNNRKPTLLKGTIIACNGTASSNRSSEHPVQQRVVQRF